jgi:hypothetical protein
LKTDIEAYLKSHGFVVFYGFSRGLDNLPEIDWDTIHHPDFRAFLDVAHQLGVKLIVYHHRDFNSAIVDRAIEELPSGGFDFEDQRQIENRLRELSMYDGFTCMLELSFDHEGLMYVFELRTEWYSELNEILDQLDMSGDEDDDEDDETFGGYYSKN